MPSFIENRGASFGPPRTHRNEFPAEYSLARCSPAERASASPAEFILHRRTPFAKQVPANGSYRIYGVSHERAQWIPTAFNNLHSACFRTYNRDMPLQVDAVYENGVLRPLQPLDLKEHERVRVSVVKDAARDRSSLAVEFIETIKRDLQDDQPAPGLEEVRRRLAKIPGSMAAEIIAERGNR
jgi:predicted DNA-binding antitoxin AbrB/MazE fold protein